MILLAPEPPKQRPAFGSGEDRNHYRRSQVIGPQAAPGLRVGRGSQHLTRAEIVSKLRQRPAFGSGEDRNSYDNWEVKLPRLQRPAFGSGEDRNGVDVTESMRAVGQRPAFGSGEDRNGRWAISAT